MRVFVAFDLPDKIKEKIIDLKQLISGRTGKIRLVTNDNMHITIKFLGDQPSSTVNRIVEILSDESEMHSPFMVTLSRVGVFKNFVNPRVLWLGEDNKEYVNMSRKINEKLDIFRPSDNEPFCHLTIGRMKWIGKDELLDVLKLTKSFLKENKLSFGINNFYLYESRLNPKGAVYRKIEKFNLRWKDG